MGLVGAFFLLGIVVGCSTLTRLGDVYGRKPIYILGLLMHLCFMFGILISRDPYVDYFLQHLSMFFKPRIHTGKIQPDF